MSNASSLGESVFVSDLETGVVIPVELFDVPTMDDIIGFVVFFKNPNIPFFAGTVEDTALVVTGAVDCTDTLGLLFNAGTPTVGLFVDTVLYVLVGTIGALNGLSTGLPTAPILVEELLEIPATIVDEELLP